MALTGAHKDNAVSPCNLQAECWTPHQLTDNTPRGNTAMFLLCQMSWGGLFCQESSAIASCSSIWKTWCMKTTHCEPQWMYLTLSIVSLGSSDIQTFNEVLKVQKDISPGGGGFFVRFLSSRIHEQPLLHQAFSVCVHEGTQGYRAAYVMWSGSWSYHNGSLCYTLWQTS